MTFMSQQAMTPGGGFQALAYAAHRIGLQGRSHLRSGRPDRDDLVQEILLQLWRSLPRFQGKAKESTWIYRVALNTALAWHRGEHKRRAAQEPLPAIEELPEPEDPAGREREELVARLYAAIRACRRWMPHSCCFTWMT
jgi:RNA polymerase sigma factor (sigma-70 family)